MSRMQLNEALPPEDVILDPEKAIGLICEKFQFSFHAVCDIGSADIVDSKSVLLSNFVPEGLAFLDDSGWWDKFDPVMDSVRSGVPVLWDLKPPSIRASPEHLQRFADLLTEYPFTECLTVPVHCGTRLGSVYFIGAGLTLTETDIASIQFAMLGVYQRLCEIYPSRDTKITPREIECLSWSSRGNTSQEVAAILSISEHTVVRHLTSATKKLAATNRGQAVAKAIRLGLME